MNINGPFGGKVDDWCPSGYREVVDLKGGLVAEVCRDRGKDAWKVFLRKGWGDHLDTPLTPGGKAVLETASQVYLLLTQAEKLVTHAVL